MNRTECQPGAFIAPDGENAAAVRELYERFSDLLLSELTSATDRRPLPTEPLVPDASPAFSRLEADLVDEFADRFGLGEDAGSMTNSAG